jgi:hypothetical protein
MAKSILEKQAEEREGFISLRMLRISTSHMSVMRWNFPLQSLRKKEWKHENLISEPRD